MTVLLADPYYSEAHEVFRRATNQTELMLDRLIERLPARHGLSVCSVGCGAGLFEIPMLERLREAGIEVSRFVGVDVSEHACAVLERKLQAARFPELEFELVVASFQAYDTTTRFDVVVFNHVVEYLRDDPTPWLEKSAGLVTDGGSVLVFSPNRGGINQPYEDVYVELTGAPPIFADDIERLLDQAAIDYSQETILAGCDISALDRPGNDEEKMMLVSFLTQRDCRELPDVARQRYVDYYRSLRRAGNSGIAHPTTLFVL